MFSQKQYLILYYVSLITSQLAEAKKKIEDSQMEVEEMLNAKRKMEKETEALQDRIDELCTENAKIVRSKKKVQEEVNYILFLCL